MRNKQIKNVSWGGPQKILKYRNINKKIFKKCPPTKRPNLNYTVRLLHGSAYMRFNATNNMFATPHQTWLFYCQKYPT